MIPEDIYFQRESVLDINAAVVGVSKSKWKYIDEDGADENKAIVLMKENRFDILPIMQEASIREYYQTNNWNNYTSVSRKHITHKDIIHFQTHIRDVIKRFANESRLFYFLSNEHRIVGLISVVNLNCRQVKVYLFSLLSELEIRLGNFITENVTTDELMRMTFNGTTKGKHEDVKARYTSDKAKGYDVPFVEYLYLSDLINVMIEKRLYSKLGYSRTFFEKHFGSLNEFRHNIAHPARSIINRADSVNKLWNKIDHIEEALFKLR